MTEQQEWEDSVATRWPDTSGLTAPAVDETGTIANTQQLVQSPPPQIRVKTAPGNLRQALPSDLPFSEITASVRLWCCHVLTSRDKRVDCRARARKTQFLPKTPALMICDLCKVSRVQANSFRVRKVVWLGTSTGLKNRSTLEGYTFRGELAFTSLPVRG